MSIGFWQIAIVVILIVLLFGRGKISDLMGDVAKGIKSFKKGMSENPSEIQTQTTKTLQLTTITIQKKINFVNASNWLV